MQKPIIAFVLVTEKYSVKVGHISNYDVYLTKNMLMNKSFNYQFMQYKEIEELIHKNYKAVQKMHLCEPLPVIWKKGKIEMLTVYIAKNPYTYYYLVPFALCTVLVQREYYAYLLSIN